jgi:septum formation inhibitor-activating ATPase MinD
MIEFNLRAAFQDVVETICAAVVDIILDDLDILKPTNIGTLNFWG